MMSLSTIILALGVAYAGPQEDLKLAADKTQTEELRMDAFFRLVRQGASDLDLVLEVAQSASAPMEQRWVAIGVLGRMDGNVAERALLGLLSNSSSKIRAGAMEALGQQGQAEHVSVIIPGLTDPALVVRRSAAVSLAVLRSPQAIPALDAALLDQDNYRRGQSLFVRRYFVEALGSIGHTDAYPALLRCLDDSDDRVVEQSIVALEKIAGFSYAEGRTREEQRQAWRRWAQSRLP